MTIQTKRVSFPDGTSVQFEVVETQEEAEQTEPEVLGGTPVVDKAQAGLEDMAIASRHVVSTLVTSIADLGVTEVEVEFGLALSAESGWLVGKVAGEATITVRASWSPPKPSDD